MGDPAENQNVDDSEGGIEEKESNERKEIEAKARNLGWVPKNEFNGNLSDWRDAPDFIQHGESTLPILRENIKRLHKKLDEQNKTISEFAKHYKTVEDRAFKRAVEKLKKERKAAVEAGDTQKFDKIDKEIEDLEKEQASKPKETQSGNTEFDSWAQDNTWYGDNIEMTIYANQAGQIIRGKHPNWSLSKVYDKVTQAVKEKFSGHFKNKARSHPASVEGGSPGAGETPSDKKTYADLPPEAKKACDRYVKEKLLTKEQFVKDFFEE